jgi:hypothetical protein
MNKISEMKQEENPARRKFILQTVLASAGILLASPLRLVAKNSLSAESSALDENDADENNVTEIENSCAFNTTVYAWLRDDISLEVGHAYWRDIHGTLISRIPGTYLYRQLHLSPAINVLSEKFQKYVKPVAAKDQPQGIAHTFYLNEAGRDRFFNHPLTKAYMVEDEVNLVRINATLWSENDNARTLKDTSNNLVPQGNPVNDEYAVSFIFKPESSAKQRKENLLRLSRSLTGKEGVIRLRYHLLEDYDDEHFPDTLVPHHRPISVRYNAWIELGVQPKTNLAGILEPDLTDIIHDIDTIHINPIFDKYTIMAKEKATIVGLKGYPAYQTILAAGAKNQLREDLLHDIYGDVPRNAKNNE